MDVLLDFILRLFPIAVGIIALNVFLSHAYKLSGGRWRELELAYPMPDGRGLSEPLTVRWFAIVELFKGEQDPRVQSWWIIARVYPDGLAISMPPIPMINYPPIFIPLSDLHIEQRTWRQKFGAYAIAAPRAPDIKIMIGDPLAAEIASIRPEVTTAST